MVNGMSTPVPDLDADVAQEIAATMANNRRFEAALREVKRDADAHGRKCALFIIEMIGLRDECMVLDVDRLRALSEEILRRLPNCVPAAAYLDRIGVEEFAIVTADLFTADLAKSLAERISASLSRVFALDARPVSLEPRIGVSIADHTMEDAEFLNAGARKALRRTKRLAGLSYFVYSSAFEAERHKREQLASALSDAIAEKRGLYLLYQPIVETAGRVLIGVEALCRWRHPTFGEISPVTFIALAEEYGLIDPLGEWALRRACVDARAWGSLRVAVNVSPHQFREPEFLDHVRGIFSKTDVDARRLELEITEGGLIENFEACAAYMSLLRELGVRLALDDFGTGYSSLSYLLALPFDKLKIDRSFILKLEKGATGGAIVHSIVSLGRALGLHITAEGVETDEQYRFLRIAGVHSIQGYLFGRPMEADKITDRLEAQSVICLEH